MKKINATGKRHKNMHPTGPRLSLGCEFLGLAAVNCRGGRRPVIRPIVAALGIAMGGLAMLPDVVFAQQIVADGRTKTSFAVNGNVTDVRTATLIGNNAFNSFSKFDVYRNNVVNLHVPNGAANLLNLVNSSDPSRIDGVLNSIRNGSIGGNVFIANPAGLIVGKSGSINAGALTVVTPTRSFVEDFFDASGNPSTTATNALLNGSVPINPSGLISVQGKINATGNITLSGGTVTNSGAILSGAVFAGNAPDFSDIVNVSGFRSGAKVVAENGNIEIVAAEDVENTGRIAADGGPSVKAGNVTVRAGRDIRLAGNSEISSLGQGDNSAGGNILVYAQRDAYLQDAARIDASAGTSGDAGNVEFSAKNTVVLAGGSLRADAQEGRSGNLLIDPENLLISNDLLRGESGNASGVEWSGGSLTLQADDKITIGAGSVISTRQVSTALAPTARDAHLTGASTGNSGDLTLTAREIELQSGAQLLAHADGSYQGGKISLEAHDAKSLPTLGWAKAAAKIDINGATIKAREVAISAKSNVDSQFVYADSNPLDSTMKVAVASAQQLGGFAATLGGVNLVVSDVDAKSHVNINSGTTIEATGAVTLGAESTTAAGMAKRLPSPGAQFNTPLGIGALYVRDASDANVTVANGATIKAGSLDVRAHNNASMEGAIASAQNQSENSNFVAIAAAITSSDVKANAQIDKGATIKVSGDVTVAATNVGRYSNEVTSKTGSAGRAAAAIAISENASSATATLAADVHDAKNVKVIAINDVKKDSTVAMSQAGGSEIDRIIESGKLKLAALTGVEQAFWNKFGLSVLKPDNKSSPTQQSFRIGGAIAYNTSVHTAAATIGADADIHASDSVAVVSRVRAEDMKIAAQAAALSTSSKSAQANDTARMAYGVGLAIGSYQHDALSVVGQDANVTAPKIAIHSDTVIPIRDSLLFGNTDSWRWTGLETIYSSLESAANIFDVFNGVSSAKGTSDGSDGSIGLSGSVSILDYKDNSRAIVESGAKLNQNAAVTANWNFDYLVAPAKPNYVQGVLISTDPEEKENFGFDTSIAIKADHKKTLLFQAGEFLPSASGEKGLGAALDIVNINNTTEAIVREGAVIQRVTETASGTPGERTFTQTAAGLAVDDVSVTAVSTENIVSLAASGGHGATFGANGTYSQMQSNGTTRALVDDEASVTARAFKVDATATPVMFSLSGGLNYSSSASVGIGVAINDVTANTRAEIADNDTISTDGNARTSRSIVADAKIKANDVTVTAKTDGHLESVAVTGAIANMGQTTDGLFTNIAKWYDDTIKDPLNKLASVNTNSQSKIGAGGTQPAAKKPSSLSISGAGSGAINLAEMTTVARVEGATIDQTKPSDATAENALTVRAIGSSDIIAASGAAALTRANRPGQQTSVGISGSVALNSTGNATEALLKNSTVSEANDVTVQALTGGEQLSVALGMAVDASSGTGATSSYAAFGSLSLTMAQTDDNNDTKNKTVARIENTSLTGQSGTSGRNVDVTAYNRSYIGTGAGSLQVTTSSTQKGAGVGAAVSWANIRNDVQAGIYDSPTVTGFDVVGVHAYNATEIGSGGAVGSITAGENKSSWSGSLVVNQITNQTTAEIVRSTVNATGNVEVTAKDSGADSTLEDLIDPNGKRNNVAKGLDYCGEGVGNAAPTGNCITAVAGTVQAGGGANIGASVAFNQISNHLTSRIADSVVTVSGISPANRIDVIADSDTSILGIGFGVGESGNKFSGAGSLSMGFIDNILHAKVERSATGGADTVLTAPKIKVEANDKAVIKTFAGQVNLAFDASSLGAAATYNEIGNEARATVDTATLSARDDIYVHAKENSEIQSLAAAGGYAKDTNTSLSLALSFIDNTTEARITGSRAEDPGADTNTVRVKAEDDSTIKSLAGSVGIGQKAGAGAAFALNRIGSSTTAKVSGASTIAKASVLSIEADQANTLWSMAAGVGAGKSGFAGSASINDIGQSFAGNNPNTITAELADSIVENGSTTVVTVRAKDDSDLRSVAGAAAIGTSATAIGAAVADNNIQSEVTARITGSSLKNTASVTAEAINDSSIKTLSAAGAGSAQGAFSGSSSSNRITNQTVGEIVNSEITDSAADVNVLATDTASIDSLSGSAAVSGNVAAGLAISVNQIDNTTAAHVSGKKAGSAGYAVRNLKVGATSAETVRALAVGVGASGEAGVAGSFGINTIKSGTKAYIDQAATVVSEHNVGVIAESDDKITLAAGAAGIGISAGGIGASYSVNYIGSTTDAYVDGASVTALAKDANDKLTVNSGDLVAGTDKAVDFSQLNLASYNKIDLKSKKEKKVITGIAVNASSSQHIDSITANVGGGTYVGVAAIESVNVIDGATRAYANNATVNGSNTGAGASQTVDINASNFAFANSFVGNIAAGAAAAGFGADINGISRTTQAYASGGSITANDAVNVRAKGTQAVSDVVVGGAVGGAGFAGTLSFVQLANLTEAYVDGTRVQVGSLGIKAFNDNDMYQVGGALAAGGNGVGGTFVVSLSDSTTRATLKNVEGANRVDTNGNVAVEADNTTNSNHVAVTVAAGGGVGIAGMASINLITDKTEALADKAEVGATGDKAGNVDIKATHRLDVDSMAGALGVGLSAVGVGAGASVNVVKATTTATANDTSIHASGQTNIEANSTKHVDATAMTAGIGSTVGIGGAAVVTLVGDDVKGDTAKEIDKGGSGTLSAVSSSTGNDHLAGMAPTNAPTGLDAADKNLIDAAARKNIRDIANGNAAGYTYRTAATTTGTGTIDSGSLNVRATDKTDTKTLVGGFGASLGVGIGGGVGVTSVKSNVAANIAAATTVNTSGNIVVSALAGKDTGKTVDITALAGGAGIVGLGAAVGYGDVVNTVDASIGGGANAGSGSITVTAEDATNINVDAKGAAAGAAAAGIVVAEARKSSTVNAALGGTTVSAGNVTIGASESGSVKAVAQSAAGGLLAAGNGSFANASDTGNVSAFTGDGTTFNLGANSLSITASATPEIDAKADGVSVSGGLKIGGSKATSSAQTTLNAFLGSNNTVNAGSMTLQALQARNGSANSARSAAFAAGGGYLLGLNATSSSADSVIKTYANVGDGSTLNVTGTTEVKASTDSKQSATVDGYNGGIVAAGFNNATASSETETLAYLGTNVKVTGSTLNVRALGTDDNYAESTSGSGGIASGAASKAKTTNRSTTKAYIRDSSSGRNIAVNTLDVNANHLARFNTKVDSSNASVLGGSGANAINEVNAVVQANLGNNVEIVADTVDINAINRTRKDDIGVNVKSASGGLFDLPAVSSTTTVSNDTDVSIGSGTAITTRPNGGAKGHLSIGARNDVQLYDMVKLDSGGALPIAKAKSTINNDQNSADVTIGSGTILSSDDTIRVETKTEAIADTEVQVKTYGAAGAAQGESLSKITTANSIKLAGARLESDENVDLLAGYNNDLRADAETRLWNKTAIPMKTSPDAHGEINQINAITIDAYVPKTGDAPAGDTSEAQIGRAAIATVKDIHLKTGEGKHETRGYGRGTDLYREFIADAAALFGADISLDITGGSVKDASASGIVNNGTLFAGTHHHQFLTIDADGVITRQSEGMATPVLSTNVDLARDISDRIVRLQALYDEYKADKPDIANGFKADIEILNAKKAKLGVGATADFLHIQPAAAYTGYIFANGGSLTGSGELIAPGDAKIEVRNASNKFMRVVGNDSLPALFIPEDLGGVVTMNGVRVSSNDEINNINRSGKTASFSKILDRQTSVDPVILLQNTYADPVNLNALNPEIHVDGDITNMRGTIKIESSGSVQVSSNLVAKTIDIATQGDFIKTFTTGFTHQGGDPTFNVPNAHSAAGATVWRDVKDPITGVVTRRLVPYTLDLYYEDLARATYPNHTPSSPSGVPGASSVNRTYTDSVSPPVTEGSVIAGNNVFISGEKLNINGLIQSGLPSYTVTISQADANAAIAAAGGWVRLAMSENGESVKDIFRPQLRWDAANARLELGSLAVAGGYIQLYGDLFSTGNGKLKVLDGYGRISVNNASTSALAVNRLDTGPGVAGMIKIVDTSTKNSAGKPLETTITRVGDTVTTTYANVNASDTRAPTVSDAGTRTAFYNPRDGRRLFWMDAETWVNQYWETYHKSCLWGCGWGIGDILSADPGGRTGHNATGSYSVRPNGQWLADVAYTKGVAQPDYKMDYSKTISTPVYNAWETDHYWTGAVYVDETEHYHTKRTWDWVERSYYVHSLNASKPISIEFSGFDTGALSVSNAGKALTLQGAVRNLTGTTAMTASDIRAADTVLVQAKDLNLTASAGNIGAAGTSGILKIELSNGGKLDAAAAGNLGIESIKGNLEIKHAQAGGLAKIVSDGDLINGAVANAVAVSGDSIELVSANGAIGSSTAPMLVDVTGANGTLKASAAKDITITENAGDMRLDQVSSIAGDVTLVAKAGSIVDANNEARVDIESKERLLEIADRAGLRGKAAEDSEANTINGYNRAKQQLYSRYWQMRNLTSDGAGGFIADDYNPSYAFHLNAADVAELQSANGWTTQQIATYEARQTAIYHSAHQEFGSQPFNSNFRYDVQVADNATYQKLIAGSTWTEGEITNRIAAGIFKDTADTEALIEKANVSGRNITLSAANGSIGAETGTRTINLSNPGAWTDEDRLALVVADRNDVQIDTGNKQITIRQKDDIDITQRDPGVLVATSGQDIYIGSEDDIRIKEVSAPGRDIRIKTGAGLVNAATDAAAPVTGRNVILEAGGGNLASAGAEFLVDLSGALTARARGDLYVRNQSGDLSIEQVYAGNLAKLTSTGAILDATPDLTTDVQAKQLWLTAATTIGQSDQTKLNCLDIGSDTDGWVDMSAPGGIYVYSPNRILNLRNVSANGGDLAVSSFASTINVIGDVSASGNVAMDAAESIVFANTGRLASTDGNVSLRADGYRLEEAPIDYFPPAAQKKISLKMDESAQIAATTGSISVTTANDLQLGKLTSRDDITLTATGGAISSNDTATQNIVSEAGKLALTAVGIDLAADSSGASIEMNAGSGGVRIGGTLTAQNGIDIASGASIELNKVDAGAGNVAMTAAGGIVNRNQANDINIVGKDITLTSTNASIGEPGKRLVTQGEGQFNLNAATGIHLEQRQGDLVGKTNTVTGQTDLYVPNGNLRLSKLSGSTVDLTSRSITLDSLVADVVKLNATTPGGTVSLGNAQVSGSMDIRADNINLPNIAHTGSAGALHLDLSGRGGAMANQVYAYISSNGPVVIDNIHSTYANVHSAGPRIDFSSVHIGQGAQLGNRSYTASVDNVSQVVKSGPSIQLYAPDPFSLSFFSDRQFVTSGAYVVNYSPEFIVNSFSTENSVTRMVDKMLAVTKPNNPVVGHTQPAGLEYSPAAHGLPITHGVMGNSDAFMFIDRSALMFEPSTRNPADLQVVK